MEKNNNNFSDSYVATVYVFSVTDSEVCWIGSFR